MDDPFSATEAALLHVFRQKGARAGEPVPVGVLFGTLGYAGVPGFNGAIETALLNLQFRGLIEPGPDPFSATSWVLTAAGDAIVHPSD